MCYNRLIANVLQSMPMYLLSAMNPPKKVTEQLDQIFAGFFWSKTRGEKGKHCVAWDDLSYPKIEGGIRLRSLHDVSKALYGKLWWSFRTSTSLWDSFMWNKYCKKQHPVMAIGKKSISCMEKMVEVREEIEHNIWWQLKLGVISF